MNHSFLQVEYNPKEMVQDIDFKISRELVVLPKYLQFIERILTNQWILEIYLINSGLILKIQENLIIFFNKCI
jgi:hypothetical protein